MSGFFKNTKIGARILVALALPVVGFLLLSVLEIFDKNQYAQKIEQLEELARLALTVSALVHELQRERGASAGFIGSKGTKFANKLPTQRNLTDVKNVALAKTLDAFDVTRYGPTFSERVEKAREALSDLASRREAITSLQITVPQMAGYYTPTIGKLLKIVEQSDIEHRLSELTSDDLLFDARSAR